MNLLMSVVTHKARRASTTLTSNCISTNLVVVRDSIQSSFLFIISVSVIKLV